VFTEEAVQTLRAQRLHPREPSGAHAPRREHRHTTLEDTSEIQCLVIFGDMPGITKISTPRGVRLRRGVAHGAPPWGTAVPTSWVSHDCGLTRRELHTVLSHGLFAGGIDSGHCDPVHLLECKTDLGVPEVYGAIPQNQAKEPRATS
jgi:hypothetical protein